ncbi:twin-arginine translocation signal domain-containing protein [Saccharomonospora sp. NPDC046836]|uniref:twin-arginine translocation signal domain-containing protein n=1 Tax=Saccharomonospora sp. NPDC046836 TaxID=3156921 RepID=UPI0033FDCA6A
MAGAARRGARGVAGMRLSRREALVRSGVLTACLAVLLLLVAGPAAFRGPEFVAPIEPAPQFDVYDEPGELWWPWPLDR